MFRQPTYTEDGPRGEAIRSEVQALMGRMQDLGSPPAEVMGEMPDFVRIILPLHRRLDTGVQG